MTSWRTWLRDLRYRALGLANVQDIPTDRFNELLKHLLESGWTKTYVYEGFDAWIDYGRVDLRQGRIKLVCEWDNWCEGSIEGPRAVIEELASQHGLTVSYRSRWIDPRDG